MRVLLIMPSFFNYPDVIIHTLDSMGIECDRFNDRPSDNPVVKAAVRLHEGSLSFFVDKMVEEIVSACRRREYDTVLIISGQSLSFSGKHIRILRDSMPNAQFVLYQWDSLANYPRMIKLLDLFDRCFSFDPDDCKKYGLSFLPLFYHNGYGSIRKSLDRNTNDYDLTFIGTAHPKKHQFLKEIVANGCFDINKCYLYEYLPSRLVYVRHKVLEDCFKADSMCSFHYKPLGPEDTEFVIARSKVILDSPQANQRGLTMRTIECLGAGKKLITTNDNVMQYDFYSERNIYVYKGDFDLSHPFFTTDYEEIDRAILEAYSLNTWLKTVLDF